jgi:hypothetical protein
MNEWRQTSLAFTFKLSSSASWTIASLQAQGVKIMNKFPENRSTHISNPKKQLKSRLEIRGIVYKHNFKFAYPDFEFHEV